MKKVTALIVTSIFFVLIFSCSLQAGEIHFTSPTNGQILTAPLGSSCVSVNLYFSYTPSPFPFAAVDGRDLVFKVDGQVVPAWENWYWVNICGYGVHSISVDMWQTNTAGQSFVTGSDVIYVTVNPTPTHGNQTAQCSRYTRGDARDIEESSYISPNSDVTYNLSVQTFNVYPGQTTAFAYIKTADGYGWGPTCGIVNSGYYQQLNNAYNNHNTFAGGILTLVTDMSVNGNGSGASAYAHISW